MNFIFKKYIYRGYINTGIPCDIHMFMYEQRQHTHHLLGSRANLHNFVNFDAARYSSM